MRGPLVTKPFVRFGVGVASVALLFGIYLVSAPELLLQWEAGATTPTSAAGWYAWPQWVSAFLVAMSMGVMSGGVMRLGVSPLWAASASLACGLGGSLWMIAVVPSMKSVAVLLVSVAVFTSAWWSVRDTSAPRKGVPSTMLLVAVVLCFAAGVWLQPLLPGATMQMSTSVPTLARVAIDELRPVAFVIAIAGAIHLGSRVPRAAWVFGAVLAGYMLLSLVGGVSPEAALVPASLLLWPLVACGLEWLAEVGPRRAMFGLAFVLAVLMPSQRWLLNQASIARAAVPFFPGSLAVSLAAVTPGATVLSDSPDTERRVARTAAVFPVGPFRLVPFDRWTGDGHSTDVFAFNVVGDDLEVAGHEAETVPRRASLSVFLRMLPPGNIVAIALTPVAANVLSREAPGYFDGIGAPDTANAALAHALIGRAQAESGALVQQDRDASHVAVVSGTPWGETVRPSPIAIDVMADRNAAAIAVEGREIVRAPHGGAVVVTSREGQLQMAYAITPEQRLSMPLPADEWSLTRVSAKVANGRPLPDRFFAHPLDASALIRFDGRDQAYFTSGWHRPERNGVIDFMWTSEPHSRLLVPLVQPLDLRVLVELSPAVLDDRDPPLVVLHVNGMAFDRQPAPPGRRTYEWHVPESAWRAGANDVAIELTKVTRPLGSHDQRQLGAAVSLVRLARAPH